MSDFPSVKHQSQVGEIDYYHVLHGRGASSTAAAAAWPSANTAYFLPFFIHSPWIARKMACGCGTTGSNNVDMGIYNVDGVRLVSSGAVARVASSEVYGDITDTLLMPGWYYMALVCNATANIVFATPSGTSPVPLQKARLSGVLQMASAYTLPATATFAALSSAIIPAVSIYGAPY